MKVCTYSKVARQLLNNNLKAEFKQDKQIYTILWKERYQQSNGTSLCMISWQ